MYYDLASYALSLLLPLKHRLTMFRDTQSVYTAVLHFASTSPMEYHLRPLLSPNSTLAFLHDGHAGPEHFIVATIYCLEGVDEVSKTLSLLQQPE